MINKNKLIWPLILLLAIGGCSNLNRQSSEIKRKHYNSWEKDIGYTQVVQVENTLYISGITSEGETLASQLEGIYETIEKILADYGANTRHIIKEVAYTKSMASLKETIPIRKKYFSHGLYPSASWVQIDNLFYDEFMMEIEIVVELPH